jgi:hypothetical protein
MDIKIKAKHVGDILIGYFGSYEDKVVFLDLSMLEFYPNKFSTPAIMSWEGFPKGKKFYTVLGETISLDMSLEEVEKLMKIYLTRVSLFDIIETTDAPENELVKKYNMW